MGERVSVPLTRTGEPVEGPPNSLYHRNSEIVVSVPAVDSHVTVRPAGVSLVRLMPQDFLSNQWDAMLLQLSDDVFSLNLTKCCGM